MFTMSKMNFNCIYKEVLNNTPILVLATVAGEGESVSATSSLMCFLQLSSCFLSSHS